ncbi:hypothetical protein N1031_17620 [Herbiconiux moechotypicola]|uniref:Uncharacterized protein n=1 Tax=Herbiconiux moechotypicola TaxID=637393 RepID=A0ABP5R248_9MICO|nr:hypothetical protein [Herbiconiux moechotypicola]MCS5731583.1 hypothetical protein [Herbiconiux moechotypicola]
MSFVVDHTIRHALVAAGGYRPRGWLPVVRFTVGGPVPAGALVVVTVRRPDGELWFEVRTPVPETGEAGLVECEVRPPAVTAEGAAVEEWTIAGVADYTVRVVSALEGADELLLEGAVEVESSGEEGRFAPAARTGRAALALDALDEPDAPRLTVLLELRAEGDPFEYEAHLFCEGERVPGPATAVARSVDTDTVGEVISYELLFAFDAVRGWNKLAATGWGGDWFLLDRRDGSYEVRVLCRSEVAAVVAFSIENGRLVAPGGVEPDRWLGHILVLGEPGTAPADMEALYRDRRGREEATASGSSPIDAEALQAYTDRAERLLATWESDFGGPPAGGGAHALDSGLRLAAEALEREREGYLDRRAALARAADSTPVQLLGVGVELGVVHARVERLFAGAAAVLHGAERTQNEALAAYRAVLGADKLAIFDEHPADAFQYLTTDGVLLETPEQLAAAEFWYFEGPLDLETRATVDGVSVTGTSEGWRVLGYRFGLEGALVGRHEARGTGPGAPLTAFRWPR